jgi:hypothetical protein
MRLRHLDQRHAGIVRARRTKPGQIDSLATTKLVADTGNPRIGKLRAELMKTRSAKQARAEPSRGAETRGAEFGMSRTNASVRFQSSGPCRSRFVAATHQS